jgi:N-methylhydantoinase B/oxoprolinase/acetone carboxylase alpha subunit
MSIALELTIFNKLFAAVAEEMRLNLTLPAGSRLSIRTPGGGGWGINYRAKKGKGV